LRFFIASSAIPDVGRLPLIYGLSEYTEAGGLMVYSPNIPDLERRAATYVDKILRGAQAGRSAHRAADEARPRHQSQDGQGARPHDPALAALGE
jgi:hypothetical protein